MLTGVAGGLLIVVAIAVAGLDVIPDRAIVGRLHQAIPMLIEDDLAMLDERSGHLKTAMQIFMELFMPKKISMTQGDQELRVLVLALRWYLCYSVHSFLSTYTRGC